MQKVLRWLTHWILSLTTTFMIMIAPIAVIVYAAESMNESLNVVDKLAFLSVPIDSKATQNRDQNRDIVNTEYYAEATEWLVAKKRDNTIERYIDREAAKVIDGANHNR